MPCLISTIDILNSEIYVKTMDMPCNYLFTINPSDFEYTQFCTQIHNRYSLVMYSPSTSLYRVARGLFVEVMKIGKGNRKLNTSFDGLWKRTVVVRDDVKKDIREVSRTLISIETRFDSRDYSVDIDYDNIIFMFISK